MKTVAERFWSKVNKGGPNGCWLWTGATTPRGYGKIFVEGALQYAHRYSYELATGEKPGGLVVCHRCDTPGCVNPAHLFVGSHADNSADMARKGRVRSGARHHSTKLTDAQVADIRRRAEAGELQKDLAAEFGVSKQHLSDICLGQKRSPAAEQERVA